MSVKRLSGLRLAIALFVAEIALLVWPCAITMSQRNMLCGQRDARARAANAVGASL